MTLNFLWLVAYLLMSVNIILSLIFYTRDKIGGVTLGDLISIVCVGFVPILNIFMWLFIMDWAFLNKVVIKGYKNER
jgi:hypothetical protein